MSSSQDDDCCRILDAQAIASSREATSTLAPDMATLAAACRAPAARPAAFTPQRQPTRRQSAPQRRNAPAVRATAAPPSAQASPFAAVKDEATLLAILKAGSASGQVPQRMMVAFEELYGNYKAAVISSGLPGADENFVARVMASVCERVLVQLTQPYVFPSFHQSIREPYDYYAFGQRYIRGLVDFSRSLLGHEERFARVQEQLQAGENVVLLANHQTEADPATWALLLEAAYPQLAADIIYVAGDRVVTDPLVVPFSMGRNLFCVHSKKHIDDVPELKAEKMATNRRTLKAMQTGLAEGGKLLWIAPSGGRDRSLCPETGDFVPDPFDASAVELMRALLTKAKPQGHIYPLAMYTFRVMPPPKKVEKAIGEKRLLNHAPVGLSLCEEMDVEAVLAGIPADDKEARQKRLAEAAFQAVSAEYEALWQAINAGPEAAAGRGFSQPWRAFPTVPLE